MEANLELGVLPDERDYGVGAEILRQLGVTKMRLMTNNPVKRIGLESFGLEVTEVVLSLEVEAMNTIVPTSVPRKERMGHQLSK